jgi:hypothetical protein
MEVNTGLWQCFHGSCYERGNLRSFIQKTGLSVDADTVELHEAHPPLQHRYVVKEQLPESVLAPYVQYIPKELLSVGFPRELLLKYQIGFDLENRRITFPVRDHKGNLVGVSGRQAVEEPGPKYKFYTLEFQEIIPGYEFNKHKYLYNLDTVYSSILNDPNPIIIVVEGFKACLWMVANGYPYTVALMGSSISPRQLELLSRLSSKFILFLDNDESGQIATFFRVGKPLSSLGTLYVLSGEYNQPDDYSKAELDKLVDNKILFSQHCLRERKKMNKLLKIRTKGEN